jgi:hypothetical protein
VENKMQKPIIRLPLEVTNLRIRQEVVLAESLPEKECYRVISIPAFIYDLAAKDIVRIIEPATGKFELIDRGGQVTIRAFIDGTLDRPDVHSLLSSIEQVGGMHEIGKNDTVPGGASLLLLSFDAKIGFPKMENILSAIEGPDVRWEYANVYDTNGRPLNWWAH